MIYQVLKAVTILKKTIRPNLKALRDVQGDFSYNKGLLQMILDEDKPVYVDLPPTDATSKILKEIRAKENPKVHENDWDRTIKEWLALGIIRKAPAGVNPSKCVALGKPSLRTGELTEGEPETTPKKTTPKTEKEG